MTLPSVTGTRLRETKAAHVNVEYSRQKTRPTNAPARTARTSVVGASRRALLTPISSARSAICGGSRASNLGAFCMGLSIGSSTESDDIGMRCNHAEILDILPERSTYTQLRR